MKKLWWAIVVGISLVVTSPLPVGAEITTQPSSGSPVRVNSPLLITGYSFSGSMVRYVQVYNSSTNVVSLEGWTVGYESSGSRTIVADLHGAVAPRQYITVAHQSIMPTATFLLTPLVVNGEATLSSVILAPSKALGYNDEIAVPTITNSTPRVLGTPPVYYFARTISGATGNYNTTFTAFIPNFDTGLQLLSDELYEAPRAAGVEIVEIYPDAATCAPNSQAICQDYVKVVNNTADAIDLSMLRIRTGSYGQSVTSSNTAQLSGWLQSGQYASFGLNLSASGSWVWLEDVYGTVRYDATLTEYPSSASHAQEAWSYDLETKKWRWTAYPQPGNTPNQFPQLVPVNICSGVLLSEVAANTTSDKQFIEIVNTTSSAINLDGCLLQTNRSTAKSYRLFGELPAQTAAAIYIQDTPLTLTKSTSGTVYLLSSDAAVEIDAVSYENMKEYTSLSRIGQEWVSTYAITPGGANTWQEFLPCEVGYERNLDTGRCNKSPAEQTLAECGEGKYRNSATNRCRAIETAGSSLLAPCAPNQVRNPETNRCRTAIVASAAKPCAANQERNVATNRCRNKVAATQADFPVEVAASEAAEATLGWWAFGGVGLIALGYAGWEWRYEVSAAIKKVTSFIPGKP